jgi:Carboxypeptidase regulatory-like domain
MRIAGWIAFAFLIGGADRAWACSCLPSSPCERYAAAEAVFVGKVIAVRVEGALLAARLEVTRVWKGTVDPVVTVTNPAGSSCSFHFVAGTRFVVYGGGSGSTFTTYVCGGGGQLRPGDPEPELPPPGGTVTGDVVRFKEVITDRDDLTDPVVGARVWIESAAGVKEAHSDESGAFTLSGVPAGDHTVHADFGMELEGSARVSLRSSDDCGRVLITPSPVGRIVGKVTSEDGQPIGETELQAIPVDHDWTQQDLSDVRNATSAPDGTFEFRGVKPGQYVVAINAFSAPPVKQPFPPTYYPGVENRVDATIVHVGGGLPSPPEPFVLKRTLARAVIVADILCRDGSVPRSAIVYAKPADERTFAHESTYEQVDGHLRLTVVHGIPYEVHGVVLIPALDASGRERGVTSLRTPSVLIDSSAPPPIVRLIAPLDRCQQTTIDGSRP